MYLAIRPCLEDTKSDLRHAVSAWCQFDIASPLPGWRTPTIRTSSWVLGLGLPYLQVGRDHAHLDRYIYKTPPRNFRLEGDTEAQKGIVSTLCRTE